ncbi:MAG: chromosome partitioning protein ParA [Symploca sp. SIO1C4]|uniref:Chromosome partitioning protein ParA n=1 Tax=Symploca sp. SIO1C4 TaxID=2607765 RepID=A0A6B3N810_9CYAN|nr:chromosome partitioning protein ParA [Symploca sp. SIO1C4]
MAHQQKKQLVIITADKGGTGKSTFARALLDYIRRSKIACFAFDGDSRNSQLYRHYKDLAPGVERINLTSDEGMDELIDSLPDVNEPLVLIDLPAQGGLSLEKLQEDAGLLYALEATGFELTIVSVLTPVKDCVAALKNVLEHYQGSAKYVAVKNLFFGESEKFVIFDKSNTREQFLKRGGQTITMPSLYPAVFELIDQHNLTFNEALQNTSVVSLSRRMRLQKWMRTLDAQLEKASPALGLNQVPAQFESQNNGKEPRTEDHG